MMQEARVAVTALEENEKRCLRNFEMRCYAEHFTLVFWSGFRTTKMVIQLIGEGKVNVTVTEKSLLKRLKELAQKSWSCFKNVVFKLQQAIGPAIAIVGPVFAAIAM